MLNPLKKRFPSLQSLGGDGNTSFLRAARAGNLDKVLEHLKNNININTSNANGLNALHLASKDGHIHVVSELLRRGAIVDSATKKGNTALHIASLAGQEEVVKMLLQHGASVNVQSQNGFTPLYMAAQENHDSVVKMLLSNGANQSLATEDGFTPLAVAMQQGHDKVVAVLLESDTRGKVRLPALHIAAKKDDVKAATLLLDNDHNPDVTSKSGFTPLHIASHYGNQAIANLLIQKSADVNFSAKHNISPLHVAAKWGKTNMVSLLLEKGANIEAKTRDGLTPLHCAARSGHEQVVDMLLERGAPISAKTKNGLAPLHMAAQGEHVDAARILLYHRAPVDEVTVDYLTALHVAAHCGHVRVAKLLLDRNADANARALNGFTPLHIACKKNRAKVVELLLRHGASISATTESGLTPLHVAAFMGCMNIVIYLLQHDASPDVPTVRGETPLHLAARANQTDIIRILLRNGAQVNARAREQQTPLHIASRLGNVDIVMLLLQHGAQIDATTKDMYTALHIAAKEGQDEVAAVLIENGAALDAATKKGFTPLHLTAKYSHMKVAQLLLQKEADVDAQGKNGVTPLHVACHYDNQNVALLLLEKGASPHAIAKNGHTPLHIASRKNQMDIATTLLEYGAQANAESKAGFTPLHISCQEGQSEISSLLIEHKASVNHPAKNGLTPMHLCAQEDNVNVAEILHRNGSNIDMTTKAGYTPLHIAAHFGQANMVRFLLQHGANIDPATSIGYTPLHQSAQQGHCHIVKLLLEHNANANAHTTIGQTPLDIARKLGYISVLDSLKTITDEPEAAFQAHLDEKYRVVAPEAMHESFMSDSEEEGGEDNMLSDQPYRYLTVDEMKSLGDDSLPIDVTRDERIDSNRIAQSAEFGSGLPPRQPTVDEVISPHKIQIYNTDAGKSMVDGIYMANGINEIGQRHVGRKLQWKSFLVSFLVDARGSAMRGCRHSGVRIIIPSRSTCQPTRVTCRYVKPQRTMHPPQLMEGEALASRVLELGPVSTKFIGPVIMEVPHFASLRGKEREIIILRSDNGETWREHTIDNSEEIIHDILQQCFEPEEIAQLEEHASNHVCRFVTYDFPQYFAVVTRIRQEVHAIGPEGGMVSSTVVPQVQAVFPQGALTKKIKVGLQAQPVDPDLTAKLLGRGVAVSPIVTVEPRRRKFHKAITLSMPAPKAHSQGMINQYSGNTPTLRLLCSITGGPSRAQWEDVTGSTPLTFVNDCVSFTTTVSARFWLMDCRNISEATKMATELYKEVIHVPFIARFVVFAKKVDAFEARLRVFCMTDDREDKTLEKMELYTQVAKSRNVEALEGKPQYIEMAGNLVPVTKSGEQLQMSFKAFRENRLPFTVRVKDQHADIIGRTLFMKEPKVAKGEPPQHPICILNVVLPEYVIPDSITAFSDEITSTHRSSLLSFSKHQNDHYIGDIRIVDLSNLLGKDWIQLATEIAISREEIDEIINQNMDSIARQAQSMIRLYKDKPNYDIHLLEQALKNVGRYDIMNTCKSGRLSHSIDFNETDMMKNSESVEELVRQECKRIQQIRERDEIKYSGEEKEIEDSESDEEVAKRTVAERRDRIVKCFSVGRQIPASSQKKEITREIIEIKRKSLIEDKKAIHESEIFMQLPADNSVKSSFGPEHVFKMKKPKIGLTELSKSDFEKELSYKFLLSSRSSEEEPEEGDNTRVHSQIYHEDVDNLKIVKDITSVEKPSKIIDSLTGERPLMDYGSKQLTEDFLVFEKLTQLPSQILKKNVNIFEKSIEEQVKETAEKVVTETVESATQKVESIISTIETSNKETLQIDQELPATTMGRGINVKENIKIFIDPDIKKKVETHKMESGGAFLQSPRDVLLLESKILPDTFSKTYKITGNTTEIQHEVDEADTDTFKVFSTEKTEDLKNKIEEPGPNCISNTIKEFSGTKDSVIKEIPLNKMQKFISENETEEQSVEQVPDSLKEACIKQNFEKKCTAKQLKQYLVESKIFPSKQSESVEPKTEEIGSRYSKLKTEVEEAKTLVEPIDIFREPKKDIIEKNISITKIEISKPNESLTDVTAKPIDKKEEFRVAETKMVAETIKSLEEPKVAVSKFEKNLDKSLGFRKHEKVLETIKLPSETFEISSSPEAQLEREELISTNKIEEKISDFEAKKLTYEYLGLGANAGIRLPTKPEEVIDLKPTTTSEESLEKLKKMKSNTDDARQTAQVILSLEQQSQLPVHQKGESREQTKLTEETFKTTITFPKASLMEEVSTNTDEQVTLKPKIQLDLSCKDTILHSIKPTNDFLDKEKRTQFPYQKRTTGKISNNLTEASQHSVEKYSAIETNSEKLSLEYAGNESKRNSHNILIMEQKQPIYTQQSESQKDSNHLKRGSIIDEVLTEASAIITTMTGGGEITKKMIDLSKEEKGDSTSVYLSESLKEDSIEITAPVKYMPPYSVSQITPVKTTTEDQQFDISTKKMPLSTNKDLTVETSDDVIAPIPVEPRISLTDVELCKSVQESIPKKMRKGLIEIADEIKIKECDIPHSSTPPPTPIERQEDAETVKDPATDEESDIPHSSTPPPTPIERQEGEKTVKDPATDEETLQTYIAEPQKILPVEATVTQETKSTNTTPGPPTKETESIVDELRVQIADISQARMSTPIEDNDKKIEKSSKQGQHDIFLHMPDDLHVRAIPVPKPRALIKTSDSFKNPESLMELQQYQPSQLNSDGACSFDYTEETSQTDNPSISMSTRSQLLNCHISSATISEEPAMESIDPPSELPVDGGNVETEIKTSFYIGESSRNIITKTTPLKLSTNDSTTDEPLTTVMKRYYIDVTDIPLMKELSVDSDSGNDVFKEYVKVYPRESESSPRIRRQSSETRNDLLEEASRGAIGKITIASTTSKISEETFNKIGTAENNNNTTNTLTTFAERDEPGPEIYNTSCIKKKRTGNLDLLVEKSEWETTEKEAPFPRKVKVFHSPQQSVPSTLTKEALTDEIVTKTLLEVQETLDAAKNELKGVLKEHSEESPSEFEFCPFSTKVENANAGSGVEEIFGTDQKSTKTSKESVNCMEMEDISSFVGVPEHILEEHISQAGESTYETKDVGISIGEPIVLHYAQNIFEKNKGENSLGFVSTESTDSRKSHLSSDNYVVEEGHGSLGFISSESTEDFSSMEEYYKKKFDIAACVAKTKAEKNNGFCEIPSEMTAKSFDEFLHRIKNEKSESTQICWSASEIDQSSSSESFYKSFERSESRPFSSDIENLTTKANSSEYQTASDKSSNFRETTEFVSAVSTLESSSGKTLSSHESMRSLDSQSEISAFLGSVDVSELSDTLVALSTEEEEMQRLKDLANEEESDDSLNLGITDYTNSENKMQQQSQMKRSQEMIFKKPEEIQPKYNEENQNLEKTSHKIRFEEISTPKKMQKSWDLSYPMEEIASEDIREKQDIALYHGDITHSIDDLKYSSSLDEGSILSVSISSTSNIETMVENFEEIVSSVKSSSIVGLEGFAASSLPDETTFALEMDGKNLDLFSQDLSPVIPPEDTRFKCGDKQPDGILLAGNDLQSINDKDFSLQQYEGKESESESDTDPYETEYARQFRSPSERKSKKKKQSPAEMDCNFETEKRPFTPSELVAEVIIEDSLTEELEAEICVMEERKPSQNMQNYSKIPHITVTEDTYRKSQTAEINATQEKALYKVKTEEQLHTATDDLPLHEKTHFDLKEENFQKLVQEQYKQKLADLKKAEIGHPDNDYKYPGSPDSFEIVDQPDISEEFVIIEEVAKEANEDDLGGKSICIAPSKCEAKHDEEIEKIIIKSAPADPKLGSQIYRDDLNFEFQDSPPTASSGATGGELQDESDCTPDLATNNKRWVEMQLTDNQLRYPYDITGGVLEDIKEEDGEFEVGSSRISSFKDSFSSTPEYDIMTARRYCAARGEHDDISMSSLQEFESLEQAISLENRNRTHQGSTDSSNGSFQRRYILRNSSGAQCDDVSISSLKEFEGLENACIEAHLIEVKAREEADLLSRSDESNKSNVNDHEQTPDPTRVAGTKMTQTMVQSELLQQEEKPWDMETVLKEKLQECERTQSETFRTKTEGCIGNLEMNQSIGIVTRSVRDSSEMSTNGTKGSDVDSLEIDKHQHTREQSIKSTEMKRMDDVMSKFDVKPADDIVTTTATINSDELEQTPIKTQIVMQTTFSDGEISSTSLNALASEMMTKDSSADSLNQISATEQATSSSATVGIYQTTDGNSQMSSSVTSCASSTLMEESTMSMPGFTMLSSYWSHEKETARQDCDNEMKQNPSKDDH